jgi:hypothetical protein
MELKQKFCGDFTKELPSCCDDSLFHPLILLEIVEVATTNTCPQRKIILLRIPLNLQGEILPFAKYSHKEIPHLLGKQFRRCGTTFD